MASQAQEYYSEEDAQAILRIAATRARARAVSHDQLVQSAAELGLEAVFIDEALGLYAEERLETERKALLQAQWKSYRKETWAPFRAHVWAYLAANGLMLVIFGLLAGAGGLEAACFPIVGWGIFVLWHLLTRVVEAQSETAFDSWRYRRDASRHFGPRVEQPVHKASTSQVL